MNKLSGKSVECVGVNGVAKLVSHRGAEQALLLQNSSKWSSETCFAMLDKGREQGAC